LTHLARWRRTRRSRRNRRRTGARASGGTAWRGARTCPLATARARTRAGALGRTRGGQPRPGRRLQSRARFTFLREAIGRAPLHPQGQCAPAKAASPRHVGPLQLNRVALDSSDSDIRELGAGSPVTEPSPPEAVAHLVEVVPPAVVRAPPSGQACGIGRRVGVRRRRAARPGRRRLGRSGRGRRRSR
jgi:hypothetical protein